MSGIVIYPSATGIDIGLETVEVVVVGPGPSWSQLSGTFVESEDIRRMVVMTSAEYAALPVKDPLVAYYITA
jgi:hypothetical protein